MTLKTVLVIGAGGREHALAWALARSPQVGQVWVAPGNAGAEWPAATGRAAAANAPVAADDTAGLIRLARQRGADLTVVGPEGPLAAGVVDAFQAAGLAIFGPVRAAAQLEASKAFAKQLMREADIATADYAAFADFEVARRFVRQRGQRPWVVKASGLAAGKGVIVCQDAAEAEAALRLVMVERAFGAAGDVVVVEERLSGPELSVMAFSDGRTVALLPPARDHKRVYDGDQGPNTGGMGAYAPAPDVDERLLAQVKETVLQRAVAALAARGVRYVGLLYAGLMLTADGPKVLEFNCRLGDPETQAVLPLLEGDLLEIMASCLAGRLDEVAVRPRPGACVSVVVASAGYPGAYATGRAVEGLAEAAAVEETIIFHAGTAWQDGRIVSSGGRVLAVSACGPELDTARRRAYDALGHVRLEGAHYRTDIGQAA